MKRVLVIMLGLVFMGTMALAAPEKVRSIQYQGSQLVNTGSAAIYGLAVSYKGVTAGDKVEIMDGLTASATVDFSIYADAANGTKIVPLLSAVSVDTGIYLNETKSGGNFTTDIQFQ